MSTKLIQTQSALQDIMIPVDGTAGIETSGDQQLNGIGSQSAAKTPVSIREILQRMGLMEISAEERNPTGLESTVFANHAA